jgi:hypothetical protein
MAQDTDTRTLTAPLAIIKINRESSGFMRNVRVTETIQRADVKGISNLLTREVPAVGITCSLSCDFFFISLKRPEMRKFLMRDQGKDILVNTLILGEVPTEIQILRKVGVFDQSGELVIDLDTPKTIASINDFYAETQNFDITENQVSGANISGRYLTPVFFNE